MMELKLTTLLILTFLYCQAGFTQIGKGNILLGGNIQFQRIENPDRQSIMIAPNGQYFINDNFSLGGSIGFASQRDNLNDDNYIRINTLIFSPEARYYIGMGENVHFYGAANVSLAFLRPTEIDGNDRTAIENRTFFSFGIKPGILFTPSPKIGFNFELNLLTVTRDFITPASTNTTRLSKGITFGFDTFNPMFGLYYIIGNKT